MEGCIHHVDNVGDGTYEAVGRGLGGGGRRFGGGWEALLYFNCVGRLVLRSDSLLNLALKQVFSAICVMFAHGAGE
jgi:hypothetical protein